MKADLALCTHVLGVPGQCKSVALMLSHKIDFYCCANRDGFCKSSHNYVESLKVPSIEIYILSKTFKICS